MMGNVLAFLLVLSCCHGQLDLTNEQLHNRVIQLEKTVEQLLKLRSNDYIGPPTSKTVLTSDVRQVSPEKRTRSRWSPSLTSTTNAEVGFHVALYNDIDIAYDRKVMFDTIEENIGLAYKQTAAEFECPISGTYLFSLNIACNRNSYVEVYIEIIDANGQSKHNILNTVCDHRKRTLLGGDLYFGNTQNGGTAIVSLSRGEKVMVKKGFPVEGLSIIAGKGFTTFTGYLLRPTNP